MPDLLKTLTILDLSQSMAGSLATMLLADCGARVIKVEPPAGDPTRNLPPFHIWASGKESIVLDLKTADGLKALHELCPKVDALIHTYAPKDAQKLGVDYEALSKVAPRLVHTSITGYGQIGARRDRPGYDALVQARFGIFSEQVGPRPGPHFAALPMPSIGAALLATMGTLAALHDRNVSGRGRAVDTSLEDGVLAMTTMFWGWSEGPSTMVTTSQMGGRLTRRSLISLGGLECGDGKYLQIHTGAPGRFQKALEVFGVADRVTPPGTLQEMAVPLTEEEADLIEREVKRLLKSKPRSDWLRIIEEADIAVAAVDPPGGVFDDPQTIHNGAVATIDLPGVGPVRTLGNVLIGAEGPQAPHVKKAPALGQHTAAVLKEFSTRSAPPTGAPGEKARRSPLEGCRLVDFGAYFAGPYGPKMVADLGADVIKVETITGDPLRTVDGAFRAAQRGKRCIALDLKDERGKKIAHELVRRADMACNNIRPGVAERLGIGFEQLRKVNPRITYVYAPGWGSSGPKSHLQSFAPLFSGLCGLQMAAAGQGNKPLQVVTNEDYFNSVLVANALIMGYLEAQRTGQAQYLESPQLNSTLLAVSEVMVAANGEIVFAFQSDRDQTGFGPLYRIYECRDDWLCLVVCTDKEWANLIRVAGLESLGRDARFADRTARSANASALAAAISDWCKARTVAEALIAFERCGVSAERVNKPQNIDYFLDPENLETKRVVEYPQPKLGKSREVGFTIRFSDRPGPNLVRAPLYGEHTREILHELGYRDGDIETLHRDKVIGWDPQAGRA